MTQSSTPAAQVSTAVHTTLKVTPIASALGADIDGIDLSAPLDEATVADIRRALLDHLVIRFRGQHLDASALKRLGEQFGDLVIHPNLVARGPHPEVINIIKEPGDGGIIGAEWHTDTTCLEAPPMGAILHALEVPPLGGDTLFANQYLAYESLSAGLQTLLCQLEAVHNDTRVAGPQAALNAKRTVKTREARWEKIETTHPVVRTHPETGRHALYVNIAYTRHFAGMTEAESAPLMDFLMNHAVRPEFQARLSWRAGDVVFWDNRCLKHIAMNDYPDHRREMIRVQITGDQPFYRDTANA